MKTEFIPIDYSYFDFNGRNYAKIYGRDSNGKSMAVIDTCDVYLWAILKPELKETDINALKERVEGIRLDTKGRQTEVEKVEVMDKKHLGRDVKTLKIYATNYKDLHDIADELNLPEISLRRGYDLGFVTHYIMEKDVRPFHWYSVEGESIDNSPDLGGIGMALDVDNCIFAESWSVAEEKDFKPKALAYDIECDEIKVGEGEILMVSLVSSEGYKKVITWKGSEENLPEYTEKVEDEAELLERFAEEVKSVSPDFLVGYFSDGFDLPYIKSRAEKFRVKLPLSVDGSQPKLSRAGGNLIGKTEGLVHIDILKFISTTYAPYMDSETLSLNDVANEFLGDEKNEFEFKHSSEIGGDEWQKYFEYNLQDSVLTLGLFEKFWPDLLEFSKITQEPVFNVNRNGMSKNVESHILHNLSRFNEIPEKRPTHDEIAERRQKGKYEGAFVFEPTPGLYENLAMWDFTSMYPSVIVSYNLSLSTHFKDSSEDALEVDLGEMGKTYFTKEKGFFPYLLEEIYNLRKKYKAEYNKNPSSILKARSNAYKLLANSSYGYLGFFGARYYCREAAAATAALARKHILGAIETIKSEGHKVVYSDTDSIAFILGDKNNEQAEEMLERINSNLPGIMELELESYHKYGLFVSKRTVKTGAKKKYALIDEEGNLKIRGFETVRRDWCELARKLQNDVINSILSNGDEKEAKEIVKDTAKKVRNREVNKQDLLIKTQLKKPLSEYKSVSPHVIAAKKMKEKDIPVSPGNLIEYYIADSEDSKKEKLVRERVKMPSEDEEYDIQYYLHKQILPAVENIFDVFGVDAKNLIEEKKQTTLGDF
ncbi:MAG: DNA polymerase domain-containing protein [Candidatus Paceibacteria bacterium]